MGSTLGLADTWDGISSDTEWYNVSEINFTISSASQLKGLSDIVNEKIDNFEGKSIYLSTDIDLENHPWIPIGFGNTNYGKEFKGNFDGGNFSIKNLKVDSSQLPYDQTTPGLGLFGNGTGIISNLSVQGEILINNEEYFQQYQLIYVGGVVAYGNEIYNCHSDININYTVRASSFTFIGFLAGQAKKISHSSVKGTFSQTYAYAGSFGSIAALCNEISQCQSSANVNIQLEPNTNSSCQGGLVGSCANISNCIFTGEFILSSQNSNRQDGQEGGIVGGGSKLDCVIFAPKSYSNTTQCNAKGLISWRLDEAYNVYYLSGLGYSNYGVEISEESLKSGLPLEGFDENIWKFEAGQYPSVKPLNIVKYSVDVPVENGTIGIIVAEGSDLTFSINPDEGWSTEVVYLNGNDITEKLIGKVYTMRDIRSNQKIQAVFIDTDNAVKSVASNNSDIKLSLINNQVRVYNICTPTDVRIYSLDGKMIEQLSASEETSFTLPEGTYIIQAGTKSFKIIL